MKRIITFGVVDLLSIAMATTVFASHSYLGEAEKSAAYTTLEANTENGS